MKKFLAYAALTTVTVAGMALGTAGAASAVHCVDAAGTTPGFSYFGGEVASGEREAKTTKGASTCSSTTPSPSERAPGQQQ